MRSNDTRNHLGIMRSHWFDYISLSFILRLVH